MTNNIVYSRASKLIGLLLALNAFGIQSSNAKQESWPPPGGSLNPLTIPKYVMPLVIPPVMKTDGSGANNYDISMRQFDQQILPPGFPATSVWSYGPTSDTVFDPADPANNTPLVAPSVESQFNYPAYTIETTANVPVNVRWRNGLVDKDNNYLPHLFNIDQTLHWANPANSGCKHPGKVPQTDCMTNNPEPYTGPVPIVTHVHGAHVAWHSDGYPESWWLPAANNIPPGFAMSGGFFDDATGTNPGNLGYADYEYSNDQPASTLWYHDHGLGITRLNVYAGPAGFWMVRGGDFDGATLPNGNAAVLPGPAPVAGQTVSELNTPGNLVRNSIRDIPIVIQDRSFNEDGSLFYPEDRSFFDDFKGPYTGTRGEYLADQPNVPVPSTDIHPIWNPEAFFNTMVVNGRTWPQLKVAPALYRFRLLNGTNARTLNLAMFELNNETITEFTRNGEIAKIFEISYGAELPFYQIGSEQGFLPKVVKVETGFATILPGDGSVPEPVKMSRPEQTALLGPAERADVIVDFRGLPPGTIIRMINTAPDTPFKSLPALPADSGTSGQVMEFVVDDTLLVPADATTTSPENLVLNAEPSLGPADVTRKVSLTESMSKQLCVVMTDFHEDVVVPDAAAIWDVIRVHPDPLTRDEILTECNQLSASIPMFPQAALLGSGGARAEPHPLLGTPVADKPLTWTDKTGTSTPVPVTFQNGRTDVTVGVTENPIVGQTEEWEIYNFSVDAHPIHLHLTRFEVIERRAIPGTNARNNNPTGVHAVESGYKDTVIAYPHEVVKVKAHFDMEGLYVWHCHILEHEDNEMMRPFVVSAAGPPPPPPAAQCADGIDNDGDGLIDFPADPGCADVNDNDEFNAPPPPTAQCADGIDNDGDGLIDFPADPGCADVNDNDEFNAPPPPAAQCADGIDNDGDGLIDFPADPGCADVNDNDEFNAPPPGGATSVHVQSLSGTALSNEGKLGAAVTATIFDDLGVPASGATVNFSYVWIKEGVTESKPMSCTTGADGSCTAQTEWLESTSSVDISVTSVNLPSLPHDPAGDLVTTVTVP